MAASWPGVKPTGWDPRGFAVGLLASRDLEEQGLRLQQWRWHYGALSDRERPFEEHYELRGRFMTTEGDLDGWFPGDHKGCLCVIEPVYREQR